MVKATDQRDTKQDSVGLKGDASLSSGVPPTALPKPDKPSC